MLNPGPDSTGTHHANPPPNTFETTNKTREQLRSSEPEENEYPKHKHYVKEEDLPPALKYRFENFDPKEMKCPHCHKHITTELRFVVGENSWSWCICCVLIGCVAGCCLLPFHIKRCKDVIHVCPHCHRDICKYKRNDPTSHRKI